MEFQDVVRKRKMVRSFEDRPIDPVVLERIVANAQRAPSAGFSQGWAFLVLNGNEETERYWSTTMSPERRKSFGWPGLFTAPVLIVCLPHEEAYRDRDDEADNGWPHRRETPCPVPDRASRAGRAPPHSAGAVRGHPAGGPSPPGSSPPGRPSRPAAHRPS